MNPLRKIADRLMNWWKGETVPEVSDSTELTGGVMTLNSPSFLESMGLSRKRKTTSEVTYFTCLKMLSETLAKMPIKYYQRTDKGITQTAKELNDATVDFRLEIKAGNVVIEGTEVGKGKVVPFDELLTWSIANAKTISNSYGEIKIDKALDEDRIDPIDAIIDAWKAAMKEEYKPDTNEVVNEWLEMYEKYMGKGGEKE